MVEFPHHLERVVVIRAHPETVFRFFTDSELWAKWWGAGSTIEAKPGGKVYIRHGEGTETIGEILEIDAPRRLAFTYGYPNGRNGLAPGGSRVIIRLEAVAAGTRLHLRHEFAEASVRDEHVQGWRFQLSLFSNVVANEIYADAAAAVDAWFGAWTTTDEQARADAFTKIAAPRIEFRDRFSALEGVDEVTAHAGAAQRFMPGIGLRRKGTVRHCQGFVLADWIAAGSDGKERTSGASVFTFAPDGKIAAVTSFTNPPSAKESL